MGRALITLDTSAIFVLINSDDRDHHAVTEAFNDDGGPYLVPAGIFGEVGYVIERRLGLDSLVGLLDDIENGALSVDFDDRDFTRIGALLQRYADLSLGFADAAVVACAERNGGSVLTLDRRHFDVVAREGTITVMP